MSDDIDALAAFAYANGTDAIDEAIRRVTVLIEVRDQVTSGRARDPEAFPGFGLTDAPVVARRVIASLFDAGWKPPTTDEVEGAAEGSRESARRFEQWRDSLSADDRTRAFGHYSQYNEFPARPAPAGLIAHRYSRRRWPGPPRLRQAR